MTDHTKWEDIKADRTKPGYVVWTGKNAEEVEAFATNANFGFVIGSYRTNRRPPFHKLIARIAAKLEIFSLGGEDKRLLEIFPDRKESREEIEKETEKIISVTGKLNAAYSRIEFVDTKMMRKIRELFNEADEGDYVPWHWTLASPGDRIYHDGTVEKPAMSRIRTNLEERRGSET